MKRIIKTGCCGFPVARLKYYKDFGCIEINATFYRLPELAVARKWRAEVSFNTKELKKILSYCDKPENYTMFDHFKMYNDALELRTLANPDTKIV